LQALGLRLLVKKDKAGSGDVFEPEVFYGKHLASLQKLESTKPFLPGATVEIACDVTSPFVGPHGATYMFSDQKGATESDKEVLEKGMVNLVSLFEECFGVDISNLAGAGAAGGLPGGFVASLNAQIKKGIQVVCEAHKVEEAVKESDVVFTGEGAYDRTTKAGKVVYQIQQYGRVHNVPVVVICGRKKDTDETDLHIYDLLSVCDEKNAMTNTAEV